MNEAERMIKLFAWGDKNDVVIRLNRFKQYIKAKKGFTRWFEVEFLEVNGANSPHRTSRGKDETLGGAMDAVWKNYKRTNNERIN